MYYLDMLWHRPDGTNIPQAEFDSRLIEMLGNKEWIIDGNYQRTLGVRLQACDTVFLMDYPAEICLSNALARIGKKREDMPWVETELDKEFEESIRDFPTKQLPKIYEMLEKHKHGKRVVIFKSRNEADDFLQALARG